MVKYNGAQVIPTTLLRNLLSNKYASSYIHLQTNCSQKIQSANFSGAASASFLSLIAAKSNLISFRTLFRRRFNFLWAAARVVIVGITRTISSTHAAVENQYAILRLPGK